MTVTTPAPAPAPAPASVHRTRATRARPIPARDVVVLGTAGPAYTITDTLRQAGLSVGSSLHAYGAAPQRCRAALTDLLLDDAIAASWSSAALIVTLWEDPLHAPLDDTLSRHLPNSPWLQLGQHGHGDRGVVRAPLIVDRTTDRCYQNAPASALLRAAAHRTDPTKPWHRTLRALLCNLPSCADPTGLAPGQRGM